MQRQRFTNAFDANRRDSEARQRPAGGPGLRARTAEGMPPRIDRSAPAAMTERA
jgi:hypothetical protein